MTDTDDIANDFLAEFADGLLGGSAVKDYTTRLKLDRRAGMSATSRKRTDLKSEAFNARVTKRFKTQVAALADNMNCSMTEALHELVEDACKARNIQIS